MKCPSCQTELPDNAKFCMACGRTLQTELVCTQCKHANPPAANFASNVAMLWLSPLHHQPHPLPFPPPLLAGATR
jgi:predicted amidophosphoribosyltransferase